MVPTAEDFVGSMSSMAKVKLTITFLAEEVPEAHSLLLEKLASESLYKAIWIASAAKIPTPEGAAIVSMRMSCSTPTATTNSCAISMNAELLRTLRAIEPHNRRLPNGYSIVFGKAVEPLFLVHRSGVQ